MKLHKGMWIGLAGMLSGLITGGAAGIDSGKVVGLDHEDRIPGQYIVVMKEQMATFSTQLHSRSSVLSSMRSKLQTKYGVNVQAQFQTVFKGFVVEGSEADMQLLANDRDVQLVEADRIVSINNIQSNATWGLDRVDARDGRDGVYKFTSSGEGVHAYVIDTGVLATHNEFAGRMGEGFSSINDGRGSNDCNGHGTHVAGTIGGSTYGVAKDVTIHGVRVLDCRGRGSNSGVIAGVDWVATNAEFPAVANMSLGGGASAAVDQAVEAAIESGITVVVAAGNSNTDACGSSPARVTDAITVGSTDSSDPKIILLKLWDMR